MFQLFQTPLMFAKAHNNMSYPAASHSNTIFTFRSFGLYLVLAVLAGVAVFTLISFVTPLCAFAFGTDSSILFSLIAPLAACIFACCVSILSNPMHALLSLVGAFLATVIFYLKSGIEFIGLVILIVYVGAVAILFLFVIMLLNVKSLTAGTVLLQHNSQRVSIFFGIVMIVHALVLTNITPSSAALYAGVPTEFLTVSSHFFDSVYFAVMFRAADVHAILFLYTTHGVLFWITTANLLLALLGSIVLAMSTTEQPRSATLTGADEI